MPGKDAEAFQHPARRHLPSGLISAHGSLAWVRRNNLDNALGSQQEAEARSADRPIKNSRTPIHGHWIRERFLCSCRDERKRFTRIARDFSTLSANGSNAFQPTERRSRNATAVILAAPLKSSGRSACVWRPPPARIIGTQCDSSGVIAEYRAIPTVQMPPGISPNRAKARCDGGRRRYGAAFSRSEGLVPLDRVATATDFSPEAAR
jgi:hypothetical protein